MIWCTVLKQSLQILGKEITFIFKYSNYWWNVERKDYVFAEIRKNHLFHNKVSKTAAWQACFELSGLGKVSTYFKPFCFNYSLLGTHTLYLQNFEGISNKAVLLLLYMQRISNKMYASLTLRLSSVFSKT